MTGALVLATASPANASEAVEGPLDVVTEATPATVADAAQVKTDATGVNTIDALVGNVNVAVPTDPANGLALGSGDSSILVGLPFSDEASSAVVEAAGIVSYDNNNGSTTVPVVTSDGTVQINTVIADATAPTRYSYPLTIPEGGQLVEADGSVVVLDANGEAIAFVPQPWAKDANGASVATHYEVEGNVLTQVVEHAVAGVQYPVVADPAFVWHVGIPSLKWNKAESWDLRTASKSGQFCASALAKTPPPINWTITALCLANLVSITVNAQRITGEGNCVQWLIGPGVISSIGYNDGNCR